MSKEKVSFLCSSCGAVTAKWFGCCPQCHEWNTISEYKEARARSGSGSKVRGACAPLVLRPLTAVSSELKPRLESGIGEWDRVTGGGIVPGAFLMLTGDPGIGKSTLLLHIAYALSQRAEVFYFSSEESLEQVKIRAQRVGCVGPQLLFSDEASLDEIIAIAHERKPAVVIIDSIQNCTSPESEALPGSIGQLREASFRLMRMAKEADVAVLLSGHITKEGVMAGPKTLEHMVDAVFYLQGEDRWQTRILRSIKNRFGTVNEVGFFEMTEKGLCEVPNINQHLLDEVTQSPGSVLISSVEGSRPLLLELQALTVPAQFGMAQRVISGVDPKQVVLIAAILEKYLSIKLSSHDLFFKVSGSAKLKSSSPDLGIALALLSSFFQVPLPAKAIALGEISLTGHIKPINGIGLHMNEALKFGIQHVMVAAGQKIEKISPDCSVRRFYRVADLLDLFS